MLKSIKREFLLNRNSLWQSLAVLGGAWLLGEALSLCIMYFAHEEEYFSLDPLTNAKKLPKPAVVPAE